MIRETRTSQRAADTIAALALGFLAQDAERLGRFLATSGLDPANIRAATEEPGFLPAVLDYVAADERLLLDFAEAEGLPPEAVVRAHAELAGRPPKASM